MQLAANIYIMIAMQETTSLNIFLLITTFLYCSCHPIPSLLYYFLNRGPHPVHKTPLFCWFLLEYSYMQVLKNSRI